MAAGVIIGGAVGVATLYVWGWRRFKYMRAFWRHNKQTVEYERRLREARDGASSERTYRAATPADDIAMLEVAATTQAELVAAGFTLLGDVAVTTAEQRTAVMRTFTDRSQTTCATIAVMCTQPTKAWLWLASYREDEAFVTMRGPQTRLAEPSIIHYQAIANETPPPKVFAQHRSFAHFDDAVRVTALDDLLAQIQKFRALTIRWRESQEPDVLLDADLRGVLGAQYDTIGKAWARRLRSRLPSATLRRS